MMSAVKHPCSQRYGSSFQDSRSDGDNALYKVVELLLTANKDLHWKVSYLEAELRTLKLADHHRCDPCCIQKLSLPSAGTRKCTDFDKDPRKVSENHQQSQKFPDKLFSWCQPDKSRNDYEKRSYPKRLTDDVSEKQNFKPMTYADIAKGKVGVSQDFRKKSLLEDKSDANMRLKAAEGDAKKIVANPKLKLPASEYKECKFCNMKHLWGKTRCSAFGKECTKCGMKNHLAEACRNKSCKRITKTRSLPNRNLKDMAVKDPKVVKSVNFRDMDVKAEKGVKSEDATVPFDAKLKDVLYENNKEEEVINGKECDNRKSQENDNMQTEIWSLKKKGKCPREFDVVKEHDDKSLDTEGELWLEHPTPKEIMDLHQKGKEDVLEKMRIQILKQTGVKENGVLKRKLNYEDWLKEVSKLEEKERYRKLGTSTNFV